jgi:DNA integrity scanning protein DisA with diadenylate cyclase activity
VLSTGKPEREVDVVLDEIEAAREGVDRAEKGALVVLLVDKPAAVWEMLTGDRPH